MKVGEYVRTRDGEIFKLNNIIYQDDNYIQYQLGGRLEDKDFLKSSPNIIDLIEVGDYVNSCKVYQNKNGKIVIGGINGLFDIQENCIYTIVTKEAFESMKYRIGE